MENHKKGMSRLKKKLLLYFILISLVSISVTVEIILELGSPVFEDQVKRNLVIELQKSLPKEQAEQIIMKQVDFQHVFNPIGSLQTRTLLLLLVIFMTIIGAFYQYTKDIVSPMEGMVTATKKIADGDLSITVPVQSKDEIGQIGTLINDMSVNLQEMILQIKQEVLRLKEKIAVAANRISYFSEDMDINQIFAQKKMKIRDLKEIFGAGAEVNKLLEEMIVDLSALQAFVNMYKVFQLSTAEMDKR